MKTLSKILTICFCIILCFSCSEVADEVPDDVIQETAKQTNEINNKYLDDFLEKNGFEKAQVSNFKDGYLINGCIYVTKQNLEESFKEPNGSSNRTLQQRATSLINYTTGSTRTITYKIDSSVPSSGNGGEWRTAISNAETEWNNVKNYSLKFGESQTSTADITITAYYDDYYEPNTIAFAYYPQNGNPGYEISINTFHNGLTLDEKIHAIIHEIGHTMGFRHTDRSYASNTIQIEGTWNSDEASVMNAVVDSWQGFSFLDILAFRTVYPLDNNLKPFYAYGRLTNKGYYWTTDWSEYGLYTYDSQTSTGYEYMGYNGFIYETQVSGTVPIYLYYSPGSNWYSMTKDPNIDTNFPGWNKIKILGYAFASGGAGRQPVYQYYHPSKGFFHTLNYNSSYTSSDPNWVLNDTPFYVDSIN